MQPIMEENISVASVGKTIASYRWSHRELESRHVKFFCGDFSSKQTLYEHGLGYPRWVRI